MTVKTHPAQRGKNEPHVGIFWVVEGKLLIDSSTPYGSSPSTSEMHCRAWLSQFATHQRIFTVQRSMLSKLFAKYTRQAKVPAHLRHFHVTKHSCAHHAIANGAGIHEIRTYLGHESLASTGKYLELDDAQASATMQTALRGSYRSVC